MGQTGLTEEAPRVRLTALFTCLVLTVAACGRAATRDPADDAVVIAAAPWALEWLASQVAPGARVEGLGQAGQDPHELDLTPAERQLLDGADVIVYVGQVGFQPQVEEAVAQRPRAGVAITEAAGDLVLTAGEHGDTHGDEHGDEAHAEDDHADPAEAGIDPHVWLDPRILASAAPLIAERLAAADPGNAPEYARNAEAVARDLDALHAELDGLLSGCRHRAAVVGHEAFAYLLRPRGLDQTGISGTAGHGETSPARLAELAGAIREAGIPAVLTEPVEGRDAAEALAREAGVALRVVDTLESPEPPARERGYPALLREQAAAFAQALECGA